MSRGTKWSDFKAGLDLTPEESTEIQLMTEVISKIVEAREDKGLTQQALADLCGVKQPVIARMERAVHSPQIDTMVKILTPLGLKLTVTPIEQEQLRI